MAAFSALKAIRSSTPGPAVDSSNGRLPRREPDLHDSGNDEDRADHFEEQAVAVPFDGADPRETGADRDPQETFGPRFDDLRNRHRRSTPQEMCPVALCRVLTKTNAAPVAMVNLSRNTRKIARHARAPLAP
jgi:hypothetical protein